MSDFGISVRTAPDGYGAQKVLMNSKYPFAKLDTLNPASFQNLSIFFSREPPGPTLGAGGTVVTQLYQFAHGYTYLPQTWFLFQSSDATYTYGDETVGIITSPNVGSLAKIIVSIDSTNITISISKSFSVALGGALPIVASMTVRLRIYVFVDSAVQ